MTNSEYQQLVEFRGRQFTVINQQFDLRERRIDALQEHMDERFREVFGHFDEIYCRLERLEHEYVAVIQALAGSRACSPTRSHAATSWSATSPT